MVVSALLGGWAGYALTLTPTSADFGELSVGAVVTREFKLTRSDTLRTVLSLEGPNASEFVVGSESSITRGAAGGGSPGPGESDTLLACSNTAYGAPYTTCDVRVDLRPATLGIKTATLVVTDAHGQRVTAALHGKAIVPECKPVLVPCNWAIGYMGTITIHEVDSTVNSDRNARYETTLDVMIDQGKVTCKGQRNEFEQNLVDDKAVDEMTFVGAITGPGMAAIEFQPENGKMSYLLTYACATPYGQRISKSLRFGTAEVDKVEVEPADWKESRQVGDPQPALDGPGMTPLVGKSLTTSWDPANKEGSYIRANWTLRRP